VRAEYGFAVVFCSGYFHPVCLTHSGFDFPFTALVAVNLAPPAGVVLDDVLSLAAVYGVTWFDFTKQPRK